MNMYTDEYLYITDLCVQIESQKLSFREKAKARTDHGAEIVIQPDSSPHRHSNTSSPGSLNAAEAPPLSNLADQVILRSQKSKLRCHTRVIMETLPHL